jgi:hypothetical protein
VSMLRWGEAERWLVMEGLLPLLGAGALYVSLGVALYVAATKGVPFTFSWKEWIDPLGWLYGGAILAVQAGMTSLDSHSPFHVTFFCFAAGAMSLLFLLAAMTNRGQQAAWQPPFSLKLIAAFLVVVILYAGYKAQTTTHPH